MARRRILVAMSGGVDSSVVAALLLEQGHEVIGVTMNVWPELPDEAVVRADACCSLKSVDDAREVADLLGIPYYVLNLKQVFAERVIDNFYDEYAQGRTPNPCVRAVINLLSSMPSGRRRGPSIATPSLPATMPE